MIDTLFSKSTFSPKNTRSTQYPLGFHGFSKIAFSGRCKKTIFVIAQNTRKSPVAMATWWLRID